MIEDLSSLKKKLNINLITTVVGDFNYINRLFYLYRTVKVQRDLC